jgi:hypothetical protein
MKMTNILNFHSSSDTHFGSDLSSDRLKVSVICLLTGKVTPSPHLLVRATNERKTTPSLVATNGSHWLK